MSSGLVLQVATAPTIAALAAPMHTACHHACIENGKSGVLTLPSVSQLEKLRLLCN
jgi:hypothetical protein